jgi:putative transposase
MILTYKYRIKDRSARKALQRHAFAVNQVWNYCVAFQRDVEARYRAGAPKRQWPSNYDLQALTAGTSKDLGIHSDSINETCKQFAASRDRARRAPRFRASGGPKRALGWVPFKARSRQVAGNVITYLGKSYRFFEGRRPLPDAAKGGAFVEDARGRWYVCFQVEVEEVAGVGRGAVGIDLGLKTLATCSDGAKIENPRHLAQYAERLAIAQRAGNRKRAKAIQAKIANARRDFLHKASTALVRNNRLIVVGDVNAAKLKKTRMAKSVSDAGWSMFREQLRYKASRHGVAFIVANERMTSQVCSCCGSNPGSSPKGIGALGIRAWVCSDCGESHDRDVNAARNILRVGLSAQARADDSRRAA